MRTEISHLQEMQGEQINHLKRTKDIFSDHGSRRGYLKHRKFTLMSMKNKIKTKDMIS